MLELGDEVIVTDLIYAFNRHLTHRIRVKLILKTWNMYNYGLIHLKGDSKRNFQVI